MQSERITNKISTVITTRLILHDMIFLFGTVENIISIFGEQFTL